ncbi:MAG: D-Ala-D-Ala carboxypeptidase family metallohydrolase [Candidatus Krumholzibacteriia bacterium]
MSCRTHAPFFGFVGLIALVLPAAWPAAAFEDGRASFRVRCQDESNRLSVTMAVVMPGESLELEVVDAGPADTFRLIAPRGHVVEQAARRWVWTAPDHGLVPLRIVRDGAEETITVNAFVLVPRHRVQADGDLDGYRIGHYPQEALRGLAIYEPPRGFIEVTPENADTRVGPHFTLRQFLCKQDADWPRFVVLRPRLVIKLEYLLRRVNAAGHPCETFEIMSGYRTPWYNHAIGNVKYSRHIYGGAADIYIDQDPRDGEMDDLDGDGKVDVRDAAVLYALVDGEYGKPGYASLIGGLGQYRRTASHGPFVHVDVRGRRARWGD